jgi:hypothetical protein
LNEDINFGVYVTAPLKKHFVSSWPPSPVLNYQLNLFIVNQIVDVVILQVFGGQSVDSWSVNFNVVLVKP